MRLFAFFMLLLIFMVKPPDASGQYDPGKVCRFDNGRLLFTLDNRWSQTQRREISELYDLDSLLLANAFLLKPVINDSGEVWKTRKLDNYRI